MPSDPLTDNEREAMEVARLDHRKREMNRAPSCDGCFEAGWLAARESVEPQQEKEITMNVQPVANMASLYALEPGEPWWMVQHNDNSDHGRGQHFFDCERDALDYAEEIEANPPEGNERHPAPPTLDVRVFAVERLR